jgi:hypothetical protein
VKGDESLSAKAGQALQVAIPKTMLRMVDEHEPVLIKRNNVNPRSGFGVGDNPKINLPIFHVFVDGGGLLVSELELGFGVASQKVLHDLL